MCIRAQLVQGTSSRREVTIVESQTKLTQYRPPCLTTANHNAQKTTTPHNIQPCITTYNHASQQTTVSYHRQPCLITDNRVLQQTTVPYIRQPCCAANHCRSVVYRETTSSWGICTSVLDRSTPHSTAPNRNRVSGLGYSLIHMFSR